MATSEPGRSDESAEKGAPPELPEEKPQRFQFSLKQLLLYMLASAIVAAGLRQVVFYVEQSLLAPEDIGIVTVTLAGLTLGALLYFFLRLPFIAVRLGRSRRRWREIQQHRNDLKAWGEARKREQAAQSESSDMQRPE